MPQHRRPIAVCVPCVVMMLTLVAAQEAPPSAPQDQGVINPESLRPGEIIIRRTGKVRLVKVSPAAQRPASTQPAATAQPAAATQLAVAAQPALTARADEGLEYGEHSVRLPLGYDPAENFSPYGPILNLPLEGLGYGEPYYGGIIGGCDLGFGRGYGYGYGRNYGSGYGSSCAPALGFGGGRGNYHSSAGFSRTTGMWIPSGGGSAHSSPHGRSGRR